MRRGDVLELIQRDLDGDLSPLEQAALQKVLSSQADYQLMYNRLKRVSDQLADLPRVTPPFSLVDAVLPQLVRDAADQTARPVAGAVAPAAVHTLPQLERKQTLDERPARRRLPVWMAKAGSGLIAACLLIGLIVATPGQPPADPADRYQQGSTPSAPVKPAITSEETPAPDPEPVETGSGPGSTAPSPATGDQRGTPDKLPAASHSSSDGTQGAAKPNVRSAQNKAGEPGEERNQAVHPDRRTHPGADQQKGSAGSGKPDDKKQDKGKEESGDDDKEKDKEAKSNGKAKDKDKEKDDEARDDTESDGDDGDPVNVEELIPSLIQQ